MRLKKIRESRGFTQDHIARKLCVTRQAISRWKNEKTQPDIQSLAKLSEIYNCSIDELVKDDTENFIERISGTTDVFNKFITWVPIIGIIYLIYFLIDVEIQVSDKIKKIIIIRISISVIIVMLLLIIYIMFFK
ncbi:helix-turn-helix transcriptional regulator [Erysipelothrix rhusiopathiae]|uniref:helix-turn-helix domain-containing protein n=1 Tax=Erysipelothrix rhusiopathiae TaxID=1648 RepID=UPI000210B56D|nr:helix-turn-helix transcriptional regulator [Erysipelothrix rhusiopathiae]AMS10752.1 hypothetical protein A2I91_02950 [Erysipelothrix rhusiopathiae]AOO66976.1 hypothetical protein BC346_01155 [Erysipelothrix rhusiopathiae]AWU41882.1 XRE family transcriptional regulator [Erysipelothrix rhusiopathiae]MDE8282878.1 helix-turn-helix transcriptional regulator [Erysipelothrix rhusiopathiae]MDV7677769.1 helix-turn-helix transcriptional regulator [Erysipelothrix rhusiopathiae]